MTHTVHAATTTNAYDRGQVDATRDFRGLNGHGFEDSCQSGHSAQYCVNYKDGYATQWAVMANTDMQNGGNGQDATTNTESGAIGGNQIKTGDNSEVNVNQFLNQRDNSPQANSNDDNSDHNGGLSSCKAFCVN